MAFSNLSFETDNGVNTGCAGGWVYACHAQLDYAEFGSSPWEAFESWVAGYLFAFVGIGTDLAQATFQTLQPTPKFFENFEEFWSSNESYVFDLAGANAAFDTTPQNFEDFEQEWDANESYKFSFTGIGTDLAYGVFTSDGNVEGFESGWVTYKFSFTGVGTDLTAGLFDGAANAFENFEGTWTAMTTI